MGEPLSTLTSTLADYIAVVATLINFFLIRHGVRLGRQIRDYQRAQAIATHPPPPSEGERPDLRVVSAALPVALLGGMVAAAVKTLRSNPAAALAAAGATTAAAGTAAIVAFSPWSPGGDPGPPTAWATATDHSTLATPPMTTRPPTGPGPDPVASGPPPLTPTPSEGPGRSPAGPSSRPPPSGTPTPLPRDPGPTLPSATPAPPGAPVKVCVHVRPLPELCL